MSDRLFVPASELYDIESQTPIAHPAHQATDADVRRALEDREREIRADGGKCLTRWCDDRNPSVDTVFGGER